MLLVLFALLAFGALTYLLLHISEEEDTDGYF